MDSKQLIDSLTSHISLYHSSIPKQLPQNQNPRTSIIRWFTSLSIHQRQSSLTVVDSNFINIILQMQTKLRQHGHGLFIILPDLPSTTQPSLPSLCFRKSKGLLSRVSQSNQSKLKIHEAARLFGSEDETRVDTMTVCEELVGNVDRFVEVMDGVSDCGFLRGEESISGADWEELRWLKERGYYSVEAFIVNKLELALRLAWLNSNGKKKSGNKLKEKANVAGIAANVFWRKKGCLDWWVALEHDMRLKVFRTVLGKSAKSLTRDILKGECTVLTGDKCLFNTGEKQPPSHDSTSSFQRVILADAGSFPSILSASTSRPPISMSSIFASLFVLQEICTMTLSFQSSKLEMDNVFFSTMDSFHTVSDYILRKFRGSVMVVSSDCIRHELLAEENVKSPLNKVGDKLTTGSRKGKGKSRTVKKLKSATKSSRPNHTLEKSSQDCKCGFACKEARKQKANEFICTPNGEDAHKETSMPIVELDYAKGLVDGKAQAIGKKSRKKSSKTKFLSVSKSSIPGGAESGCTQTATESVSLQLDSAKTDLFACDSPVCDLKNNISIGNDGLTKTFSKNSICKSNIKDDTKMARNCEVGSMVSSVGSGHDLSCCESSNKMARNCHGGSVDSSVGSSHDLGCCESSKEDASVCSLSSGTMLPVTLVSELNNNVICHTELTRKNTDHLADASPPAVSPPMLKTVDSNGGSTPFQRHDVGSSYAHWPRGSLGSTSYEWPTVARYNIPFVNSQHLPAATDRLHLDVGCNWRNQLHQSFVSTRHQTLGPSIEGGRNHVMPRTLPVSLDWPPMVRTASRLTGSIACNYDSGFIPRIQSTYQQGRRPHKLHPNGTLSDEERKYPGESMDSCDFMNTAEVADCERHWVSDEEFEVHALSERDYNQYFGGGVMYWNTTDHAGTGCSRPPSLSSDDSSWAWHEADLNRAIDDMVGIPSTYGSNGLTSPPSGSFCSPFDPMGPGHQSVGYIIPGSDMTGKANHPSSNQTDGIPEEKVSGSFTDSTVSVGERQNGDLHPYPILRPIIIPNMSRKGSRSEFKVSHDHRSPCVSISRRDQPRIKRPPSPVVLCVPRAPGPPPFSPVLESRKRRGFPTVRSGSSSPRHWGMRSWYHDGNNPEDAGFRVDGAEVVWPSWRSKGLSVTSMIQPLQGALLQDHLIAISQLALDQEHPDAAFPLQPPELLNCPSRKASLPLMHSLLHDEIDSFCKQVAAKNINMKPCINWAVKRVARSLQVLWPRSRTNIFGSNATGLSLPTSDVDLVVCLPPVRNLEPIKEAGILEGRNGIKETCLQHAARYLANQEWVKNDSLKTVENTAIPIIMLVVEVPQDVAYSGSTSNEHTPAIKSTQPNGEESSSDHSDVVLEDHSWKLCADIKKEEGVGVASVRLDISFKSPSHTGLQTTELVRELTEQFPAAIPLALVLKQFLADRSLDHSYSGGLSSYCLVLLITRFLQHEHHLGRPINQNLGSLLTDFLYFFGNVFDPRQMRVSIQGSGVYVNRERGHSIDPIHIDDPLFPTNNVGKNCFRIHQCIKAFAEAYSTLESELTNLSCSGDPSSSSYSLLQKIIPSIDHS